MRNIVFIGMPGSGKSTIGSIISKRLDMSFIDTDNLIKEKHGQTLQGILNNNGAEELLGTEERVILDLNLKNFVVSTGGSAVCSEQAIKHLKGNGTVIYLKSDYDEIEKRIRNINTRGIVFKKDQDLKSLYYERLPLYEKYADITIDCTKKTIPEIIELIEDNVKAKKRA